MTRKFVLLGFASISAMIMLCQPTGAAEQIFERELSGDARLRVFKSTIEPLPAKPPDPPGVLIQGEAYTFVRVDVAKGTEVTLWRLEEKRLGFAVDKSTSFTLFNATQVGPDLIVVYRHGPGLIANIIRQTDQGPREMMKGVATHLYREIDVFGVRCTGAAIEGGPAAGGLHVSLIFSDGKQLSYAFDEKGSRWVSRGPPGDSAEAKHPKESAASQPHR